METESQVDRIDAALVELRRLGRPHPHRRARGASGGIRGHDAHGHHRDHGERWRERRVVGLARHRMLSVLSERPGLGITELAEAIGVDQPRASRLVNDAADAGLIQRGPDPRDGRRSVVELTPTGREHLERTMRERRAAIEGGLEGFTASEAATFADLLERFSAALRVSPATPDSSAVE